MTRVGSPVSGSGSSNFELVLPPPKLVMRRSSPSRFERYRSSSSGLAARPEAVRSSHRFCRRVSSFVDDSDTGQLHVIPEAAVVHVPAVGGRGFEALRRE